MPRLLVIDCQILQTPAYDRGMGKYTLSLLASFAKQDTRYNEIRLLLNENLIIDRSRIDAIKNATGITKVVLLDLPVDISTDINEKYQTSKDVISRYIANLTNKHDVDFYNISFFCRLCRGIS